MPRHTQLGADQSQASISRGDPEPGPMRGRACGHLLSPSSESRLSRPTAGFLPPPPSSLSAVENLPGWCCERELSISLKVFIAYLLRSNLLFARLNDGITSSLSKLTSNICGILHLICFKITDESWIILSGWLTWKISSLYLLGFFVFLREPLFLSSWREMQPASSSRRVNFAFHI